MLTKFPAPKQLLCMLQACLLVTFYFTSFTAITICLSWQINMTCAFNNKVSLGRMFLLLSKCAGLVIRVCYRFCEKLLFTPRCVNHTNRGGEDRIPTAGMRTAGIFVISKHSQSKLSPPQLHTNYTHNPTGLLQTVSLQKRITV